MALISKTVIGLQNKLNLLYEFCKCWKLSVNVEKTKIDVFKKAGVYLNTNNGIIRVDILNVLMILHMLEYNIFVLFWHTSLGGL